MKKIVITGPESSGKTTLAEQLAAHFHTLHVKEYSRIYLHNLSRPYEEADLFNIAKGQLASEEVAKAKVKDLLICDTSLEVIKIWSEVKYNHCHPWILEQYQQQQVNLYLLCSPDIPWEYDPQRENPADRNVLFKRYQHELTGKSVIEIRGSREERLRSAIQSTETLLK